MNNKRFVIYILIMLIFAGVCVAGAKIWETEKPVKTKIEKNRTEKLVDEIMESMTTEEKVGQMFMGCFYSKTPSAETVDKHHLGGVLLFGPSFENTDKKTLNSKLDSIDEACNIPPIVAVDEEGGLVARVSRSEAFRSEPFKSPGDLYREGGLEAIEEDAHEKNALLKSIGIDLNLAPVCDISTDPDDYIYSRSLGEDAETTASYIETVVSACVEDGMGCSLKHFPGYGNATDTHKGKHVSKTSAEQLWGNDLLPFIAGIDAGAHCVLVSHNTVASLDKEHPASLSPAVNSLLRNDIGFEGVVITDDLIMGAVTDYGSAGDAAIAAVLAGNDMICSGDYKEQYTAVLKAVEDGVIDIAEIDDSVKRILTMKVKLGVITPAE
ncbi:MAG: glycoside hydrolase family 3 N-terminal domain-containing protein [Bacillota bacterium]|nr:glycoside hydrolase family 3 N-terminal domain-containing protein [Bacillota bacterium]